MRLTFVETPLFAATAKGVVSDEELRAVQAAILANPEAGAVERGTGGARKIRVALPGAGKSGGARVIYVHAPQRGRVYLLVAFAKNVSPALSDAGRNRLREIVRALQEE